MKIHEELEHWLVRKITHSRIDKVPDYGSYEKCLEQLRKIDKEYKNNKLIILKQKLCEKHEWISDLSEQELNFKHNIITDDNGNPTDERWDYGSKICKLCGVKGDLFCPKNAPSHDCEYNEEYDSCHDNCIYCHLPEERK